jgi:carbon monoxide dehydrogenase subunit G
MLITNKYENNSFSIMCGSIRPLKINYIRMKDTSKFESRTGKLSCTTSELFNFITDIRNFEQFIPEGNIKNWEATAETCNFQVPPLGNATLRITERIPNSYVAFSGDALKKNDFDLFVHITESGTKLAEVRIILSADLNPVLRMMASGPIEKFLEKLILEMEKFEKWNVKST